MEVVIGIGFLLIAASFGGVAFAAMSSNRHSPLSRPHPGLKSGTEQRLVGLLSASGRKARVHPYTLSTLPTSAATGDEEIGLRFTIEGLCPSVVLWRPSFPTRTSVSLSEAQDIGEPAFDLALRAAGSRADALALLDSTTRTAIRDLLLGSVRIGQLALESGTLTVEVPTMGFVGERPGLDGLARSVAGLAASLGPPRDVVPRLAENLARDPIPGVRLANLRALLEAYGTDPGTRAAVTASLRDADQKVRLEAALAAGAQGRETLIALAVDPGAADACAARAIDALGSDLPLDRVEPLAREAAHDPTDAASRPATTRAFIAALARIPSEAATALLRRLGRGAHDTHGAAAVDAIAAPARPGAELLLIEALETWGRDRPRTIEAAAIRLGSVGTADAVLPLQEATRRHGGAVASAARKSIAQIQERIAGSPGRLALTDGEAGRLSEVKDASGQVSLSGDDD